MNVYALRGNATQYYNVISDVLSFAAYFPLDFFFFCIRLFCLAIVCRSHC